MASETAAIFNFGLGVSPFTSTHSSLARGGHVAPPNRTGRGRAVLPEDGELEILLHCSNGCVDGEERNV